MRYRLIFLTITLTANTELQGAMHGTGLVILSSANMVNIGSGDGLFPFDT